ncbi:MAG: hypothetical protein Q8M76_11780, partial [Spirochaetaceae bacterium]|nr:hypothetical protein [Spirochaetaceae bacterium]
MRKTSILAISILFCGLGLGLAAEDPRAVIVPDRFLRGYDPVTILFDQKVGPEAGGPLDGATEYLSIEPAVDGEFSWIDSRTIRFMPSLPWPPLKSYRVSAAGSIFELTTMIAPPSGLSPAAGGANLEPFSSITLTFPSELGPEELRRMISIEQRDLPGVSTEGAQWLPEGAFSVTELEAGKTAKRVSYRITLDKPTPYGKRILLHIRLSPDPALSDALMVYSWETRPEFRLVGMGGGSIRLPVPASGATYAQDQALDLGADSGSIFLEFSETLAPPSLESVKKAVAFDPAVRDLRFETAGQRLVLRFDCDRERLYGISVDPGVFVSAAGRVSSARSRSSFYVYMKKKEAFLTWKASEAVLERFGPRQFPMEGRATGRADLRIHRIDPLSYDFQPFPKSPIAIDEASRPPMPGEEPAAGTDIASQIRLLGSPPLSRIIDLPIDALSARSSFGLDLGPYLDSAFDDNRAGTYLVGLRSIDASSTRYWVKAVVTDLCLTAIEEERAIRFFVSSLSTGEPVPNAIV